MLLADSCASTPEHSVDGQHRALAGALRRASLRRSRRIRIARWSTTSPTRRASGRDSAALLFKGATVTYARAGSPERRVRRALSGARRAARRSRRAAAAQLPAVPHRPVRRVESRRDRGAAQSDSTPSRSSKGPLREHGIETIVTLTRFYDRVKRVQPRTPLRRVIATNIKEYFPPLLRLLFTLVREKRDGDRIALAPGDHDFARLLANIADDRRARDA